MLNRIQQFYKTCQNTWLGIKTQHKKVLADILNREIDRFLQRKNLIKIGGESIIFSFVDLEEP